MKLAFIGLFTIGLCVVFLAWLVPNEDIPTPMWFFIYLALAATAVYFWRHPKSPRSPVGWLKLLLGGAALGVALMVVDTMLFGLRSGWIVLDLSAAMGLVIVAFSGLVRSLSERKRNGA